MEILGQQAHPFGMAKKVLPRFKKPKGLPLLRAWRKYRSMTGEQLAERAGMTPGNISQLENGLIRYSQDGLEALAEALNCRPGELLSVDPSKEDAIWSLWERATAAEKAQIVAVGQALTKKAAGGS